MTQKPLFISVTNENLFKHQFLKRLYFISTNIYLTLNAILYQTLIKTQDPKKSLSLDKSQIKPT
jgi:hypothetical protein